MKPIFDSCGNWTNESTSDDPQRKDSWHVRRVDRGEAELVATQLTILFSAVSHPLRQTLLMNVLDTSGADAWKEEGTVWKQMTVDDQLDVDSVLKEHVNRSWSRIQLDFRTSSFSSTLTYTSFSATYPAFRSILHCVSTESELVGNKTKLSSDEIDFWWKNRVKVEFTSWRTLSSVAWICYLRVLDIFKPQTLLFVI